MSEAGKAARPSWSRKYGVDAVLFILSALCFTLFAKNSPWNSAGNGSHLTVARVISGQLERKSPGMVQFEAAMPGQDLFNMDTLWVGKGGAATVEISFPRWQLDIPEQTLLVLKKTFKENRIVILAERKKMKEMKIPETAAIATSSAADLGLKPESIPALVPRPPGEVKADAYPPEGLTIYRKPEDSSDFSFSWPQAEDGYLQVRRKSDRKVFYFPIQKRNSIHVPLSAEDTYFWQVIGPDRKVLIGPYSFNAKVLTEEAKKNLLQLTTGNGKVEVHW